MIYKGMPITPAVLYACKQPFCPRGLQAFWDFCKANPGAVLTLETLFRIAKFIDERQPSGVGYMPGSGDVWNGLRACLVRDKGSGWLIAHEPQIPLPLDSSIVHWFDLLPDEEEHDSPTTSGSSVPAAK